MQILVKIDPSWLASPSAIAEFVRRCHVMERPSVAFSPPIAGDAGKQAPPAQAARPSDAEDLATLLDGINDPEPASKPMPGPTVAPQIAAAKAAEPTPRTGRQLYRWACDRKALPKVNAIGKARGLARLVSDWSESDVDAVFNELAATRPGPAVVANGNGRPH